MPERGVILDQEHRRRSRDQRPQSPTDVRSLGRSRDEELRSGSTPDRQADVATPAGVGWSAKRFARHGHLHRHHHPEGQLFLLDEGTCEIRCHAKRWLVRPGQPCWVPPHVLHEIHAASFVTGRTILIAEDFCISVSAEPAVVHRADLLTPLVDRLTAEDLGEARAQRLVAVLVDELAAGIVGGPVLRMPSHDRLRTFALLIAEAPDDQRDLAECARAVGMSPRTFSRRFTDETGLSFVQWRSCARIIKAAELIRQGTTVTQAGLQVGYDSQSAFSNTFRHWMGATPTDYRKAPGAPRHRATGDTRIGRS